MESKDKDSMEWRERQVRHSFGAIIVENIKSAKEEKLKILLDFISDVLKSRK